MAKLQAPEDCTSVSVEGKEYEIKNGVVDVDQEHVATLLEHGFTKVKAAPEKAAK